MRRVLVHRDPLLAVAFFVFGLAELAAGGSYQGQPNYPGPWPVAAVGVALMTLPLAVRRSHASTAAILVFGAVTVSSLTVGAVEATSLFLACMVASFSLAAYAAYPWLLAVLPFAAMFAHNLVDQAVQGWGDYFWSGGMLAVALLLGAAVRNKEIRIVSLEESTLRLEEEHDARVAAATAAERAAIARELHDIVAHSVSVIVVQAQAAGRAIGDDPETTGRLLDTIETTGRSALDDLRRLLRVLSSDGAAPDPSPGLAQVPDLVARVRALGLEVALDLADPAPRLSTAADLAAYRLVQESLTNTVRHAPDAAARVVVESTGDGAVQVTVSDTGSAHPARDSLGSGRGLIGMRERVDLAGGSLIEAGLTGQGFRVRALLPEVSDDRARAAVS